MRFARFLLGCLLFAVGCISLFAQGSDQMSYASIKQSKFGNLPVLPSCMTISVQRGDPSKGASVIAAKFTSGCKVPWHWHTANENLVLISGSGRAEVKDGGGHVLTAGDFLFLPGKQTHQFTCTSACVIYDMPEGAFDIHYVEKDGKEIPADQVLKPPMKAPASAKQAPAK
jgi:quercetin dioxygenase-like cupin family protein